MPEIPVSFGSYQRTGNPNLVAQNCYAEQVPGPNGPRLQLRQRPGLENFKTVGVGPQRAIAQKDGLFGNAALILSGSVVWMLDGAGTATALPGVAVGGAGTGTAIADMDLGQDSNLASVARIATGEGLYKVTTLGVTKEDFPAGGGAGAESVCFHRGFWFATEVGTQQAFFQVPGDTVWTALSFASAEYSPDPLVGIRSRGDQFALLGSSTFEPWTLTGNASPAIAPYGGLNGDFGCRALPTAVNCKGSLLWVDNECNVRRWDGGVASIISGPGLSELIRQVDATDLRAWTFAVDGHRFYALTIGTQSTWAYDLKGSGAQWTTLASLGLNYWRAHLGTSIGDTTLALDSINTQIYRLDPARDTDGSSAMPVICSAVVDGQDSAIPCANVTLLLDVGDGPYTGQGSAPQVGMRRSDDQGKTFSDWSFQPLPVTGQYNSLPRWTGLGEIPAFMGAIFQFTISDPVGVVFKRLFLNTP